MKYDVIIIGSGLSGLAAARAAKEKGLDTLVLEKSDSVGGRASSEIFQGCILDKGFQVLLPAYPSIKTLNLNLELKYFNNAAITFSSNKTKYFNSPLSKSLSSNYEKCFTLFDLIILAGLLVKNAPSSISQVLEESYLSESIKKSFLRPFLKGIFLDPNLTAPWNIASFYIKSFIKSGAAIPSKGIGNLAQQLSTNIKIDYHKEVIKIENDEVFCSDNTSYNAKIIIDTRPNFKDTEWFGTSNYYFLYHKPLCFHKTLHLFEDGPLNTLVNLTEISESYSPKNTALLSVSTIGLSILNENEIKNILIDKLKLSENGLVFLKKFDIKNALSKITNSKHYSDINIDIKNNTILTGDYLSYGSQHAAISSGIKAIESLNIR